jgi:hypothetical protein
MNTAVQTHEIPMNEPPWSDIFNFQHEPATPVLCPKCGTYIDFVFVSIQENKVLAYHNPAPDPETGNEIQTEGCVLPYWVYDVAVRFQGEVCPKCEVERVSKVIWHHDLQWLSIYHTDTSIWCQYTPAEEVFIVS